MNFLKFKTSNLYVNTRKINAGNERVRGGLNPTPSMYG